MDFDTEHLKDMMQTCKRFLEVGDFDVSKIPDYSDMSNKKFIKSIDKRLEDTENDLFRMMEEVNMEITFRSSLSDVYVNKEDEKHTILILFYPDETVDSKSLVKDGVKKFLNLMRLLNCREGVLISEKNMASAAKKEFDRCNMETTLSETYNVIFYNDENFINIIDHISHSKVIRVLRTADEISQFEAENKIDVKKLPSIEKDDPLVKFYRAKIGNIFELERPGLIDNLITSKELTFSIVTAVQEIK